MPRVSGGEGAEGAEALEPLDGVVRHVELLQGRQPRQPLQAGEAVAREREQAEGGEGGEVVDAGDLVAAQPARARRAWADAARDGARADRFGGDHTGNTGCFRRPVIFLWSPDLRGTVSGEFVCFTRDYAERQANPDIRFHADGWILQQGCEDALLATAFVNFGNEETSTEFESSQIR